MVPDKERLPRALRFLDDQHLWILDQIAPLAVPRFYQPQVYMTLSLRSVLEAAERGGVLMHPWMYLQACTTVHPVGLRSLVASHRSAR